jgi:SAM-dependent methyltransferase
MPEPRPTAANAPKKHRSGLPSSAAARDAEAGCREPFVDAELYDYEYRHRRADINFYRRLAKNRMEFAEGEVLDLACGSGRLLLPLVRDGHRVVGVDRSAEMLAAAARRVARLSPRRRAQCSLAQSDMRSFALGREASLAIAAFHSVQHLLTDEDFLRFLRATRENLCKGGWLAFDVLPPDPEWLNRDPERRWARTTLRHPVTRQRLVYTTNHVFDAKTRLLHMRLYYQPVDGKGCATDEERVVRLCHRQWWPEQIERLLQRGGFRLVEIFGDFDGGPMPSPPETADEHVYMAVTI